MSDEPRPDDFPAAAEPKLMCEVCRSRPATGVCCSSLGPISHAYCSGCLSSGAEPFETLVAAIFCIGGATEPFEVTIPATLERTGRSQEELTAAVQAVFAAVAQEMGR